MKDSPEAIALQSNQEIVEIPATLEQWKAKAEALWGLLDDISTCGDMYKPEHTKYFIAVERKCNQRGKYLTSDGYRIINERN